MIFLKLFFAFFLIGLFTFGGGYGMIPIIKDVVVNENWLDNNTFTEMIGLSEITPGPIAINMATYVGSIIARNNFNNNFFAGFFGSLLATFGVILPAFLIMLLVAFLLKKFIDNKYVQGVLNGIKPVAVGLILATGFIFFIDNVFPLNPLSSGIARNFDPKILLILLLTFIVSLMIKKGFNHKVSPILTILISAFVGLGVNLVF